jgi:PAS domain S-box-containing protein
LKSNGISEEARLTAEEATLLELARAYFPGATNAAAHGNTLLSGETRYQALIEQIPAVVFLAQLEGGLGEAYISPQIETILGFKQDEWLGDPIMWFRQLHSDDKDRWSVEAAELFMTGEPLKSTYRVHARDGSTVWFRCEAKMVRHEDGQPWFIHGVGFDITEMKRAEEALEKAHAQLESRVAERTAQLADSNAELGRMMMEAQAANLAKGNFLATMSHEIRTPMNGVLGMTQVLLDTPLSAEQREATEIIRQSADSLVTIIDDILDFSKIEAGKLELESTSFQLSEVVNGVLRLLTPKALGAGLQLQASEPLPNGFVSGDPTRLRQVLMNLVGNAIKFTKQGRITVAVERVADDPTQWHFQVEDAGIGIPPEKQHGIFEAFSQVDNSITRRFGGSGLGLTISASLVKAMGGRIWVDSEPGRGSTFHFTIAVGIPEEANTHPALGILAISVGSGRPDALRILLVEDNVVNQKVATSLLRNRGHHVTVASNGKEGAETAAREAFDAILMDVQMPVMDGWEATAAIRAKERASGAHVPIIAMTAHIFKEDIERCLAVGMDIFRNRSTSTL